MSIFKTVLPSMLIAIVLIPVSSSVIASGINKYEKECESYAKEESIPESELSYFIEDCIQSIKDSEKEDSEINVELQLKKDSN